MRELEPVDDEMLAFYIGKAKEFRRIADALHIPSFTKQQRVELGKLTRCGPEGVGVLESAARLGDYANKKDYDDQHVAVRKLLRKKGVRLPRGKRPDRRLTALVKDMTPLLLRFGVPLAFSERSRLVEALRVIAGVFDVRGDPRDELRRLKRKQRAHAAFVERLVYQAFLDGLATPDKH